VDAVGDVTFPLLRGCSRRALAPDAVIHASDARAGCARLARTTGHWGGRFRREVRRARPRLPRYLRRTVQSTSFTEGPAEARSRRLRVPGGGPTACTSCRPGVDTAAWTTDGQRPRKRAARLLFVAATSSARAATCCGRFGRACAGRAEAGSGHASRRRGALGRLSESTWACGRKRAHAGAVPEVDLLVIRRGRWSDGRAGGDGLGLPTVTTTVGASPRCSRAAAEGLYVPADDTGALGDALEELVGDRSRSAAMGSAGPRAGRAASTRWTMTSASCSAMIA